jgi:hypothetical protein
MLRSTIAVLADAARCFFDKNAAMQHSMHTKNKVGNSRLALD